VLEILPGSDADCDAAKGLEPPDTELARAFVDEQHAAGRDMTDRHVCALRQLPKIAGVACKTRNEAGWCYAEADEALAATRQKCLQALVFTRAGNPPDGVTTTMRCIEQAE
jgi:hypothetical protein